jgi:hypothetical protein
VAAGEFQVRAPLKEAGLTKSDLKELLARENEGVGQNYFAGRC